MTGILHQATNWELISQHIEEAKNHQDIIMNCTQTGDKFDVKYRIEGVGHNVTKEFTVEKLYPNWVLVSRISGGVKIYNGFAYEDIYQMKSTGRMPRAWHEDGENEIINILDEDFDDELEA